MGNPWAFYLDTVDTGAYDKAESGWPINPKSDWPFLPLVFPWLICGPLLAILPLESMWATAVFMTGIVLSIGGYLGFGLFYTRRVKAYRDQLGIEVQRPSLW